MSTIEAIDTKLDGLRDLTEQRFDALEKKLDRLNGSVRQHGEDIAAIQEWKENHKQETAEMKRQSIFVSGIISTIASSISGGIAWLLSR